MNNCTQNYILVSKQKSLSRIQSMLINDAPENFVNNASQIKMLNCNHIHHIKQCLDVSFYSAVYNCQQV